MRSGHSVLFPGLSWWLLLLVPFIFLGFYPTYFSKPFLSVPATLHIHTAFLLLWVLLVLVQPVLILKRKLKMHRLLGKASYALMPCVLATTWLVIRNSYWDSTQKLSAAADHAALEKAKEFLYIPIVYLLWLGLFYALAVIHRKRVLFHATYMFAAILTLLGPSLDRLIYQVYQYYEIGFNIFADIAVFLLIDGLLLGLLYYQWKKGYSLKAVTVSLFIYVSGQLGNFILPATSFWKSLLGVFM